LTDDSTDGLVILFGGKGRNSVYYDDTWAYSPESHHWVELKPTGARPAGRFGHSTIYDPANHRVLLFGGVTTSGIANDLWAYRFADQRWQRIEPVGIAPPARVYPAMVDTPVAGKVIMFGGWTGSNEFSDTWIYEPATNRWREAHPVGGSGPRARWGASMVYDSANRKVLLFGGLFGSYDGSTRLNDTWEYDPVANSWHELAPAGPLPPARGYASMVYDPATDTVILFGGFAGSDGLMADEWEYSPGRNTWKRLDAGPSSPSRRDFGSAAYDPRSGLTILFGGLTGNTGNIDGTLLNDTWQRS
jgi:N-acetylneuraminic acid mutarotase